MNAALLFIAMLAPGLEPPPEPPPPEPPPEAPEHSEEKSHPDYGGSLEERAFLSGDWDGSRGKLADQGVTFELGWTQIGQGVVAGGRRIDWDYGGNLDALVGFDFGRLGLIPGGSLALRVEARYSETVNDDAGALTPVNTRGYFPLTERLNGGIVAITELKYTQAVGDTLELIFGKMRMAEGDPTEFAGGGGRTQFFNSNFIYNVATSQTAPYSTLGAAADWFPAKWITLSTAIFATTDSSTTSGFDHLDDGWTWWSQAAVQYRLGTLPGGVNVGAQYAFDGDFIRPGGRLSLVPGGAEIETVSDSWAVFAGAWQYLYTPDTAPEEINAGDDRADLRGLGVFARFGFADPRANPVDWSASLGLGGRGLIPGRDEDSFGVAYYYTKTQAPRGFALLGLKETGQGLEAYYNIAITRAVGLTFDVQWIDEGLVANDPATVVGARLHVDF